MHLVAIARAAGITLTWDDLSDLSAVVPLLSRMYPNGEADVNHFHAAGGIAFMVHTLLARGPAPRRRADRSSAAGCGATRRSRCCAATTSPGRRDRRRPSTTRCCARRTTPFSPDGGLRMLTGPLGRAVIKTSAVKPEHRLVTAPAVVFDDQHDFLDGVRRTASSTAATSSR